MPSFNEYVDVDIDIDVSEFLCECDLTDIDDIIEWLIDNDYIDEKSSKNPQTNHPSYDKDKMEELLDKIKDSYYLLSVGDEETIKQIANKL
jgi:predicted lipase